MSDDFERELVQFATKVVRIKSHCPSEESTKIFLVLPFLAMLGYDASDPTILVPEHDADLHPAGQRKVDFAIMLDGQSSIAIEVKKAGSGLLEARAQLKGYYNHLPTARLGIATNGTLYEFFVDSEQSNLMDAEPFLTLDLEAAATGVVNADVLKLLKTIRCRDYEPAALVEQAFTAMLRQRLRTLFLQEFRSPSDEFCRSLLGQLDIKGVRGSQIEEHFRPMIRSAMEEAIIAPVLQSLRAQAKPAEAATGVGAVEAEAGDARIGTTSEEIEVLDYARRRLAFLVETEQEYAAVEEISAKDYIGKFVVFLGRERKGRLFDYIAMGDGRHRFVFPEIDVDIVVARLEEIDEPLLEAFRQKFRSQRAAA